MFKAGKEIEVRTQNDINCVDVLIKRLKEENDIIANLRSETIFHTRCGINGNICSMIIDSESDTNMVSSYVVKKLKLTCIQHTTPYKRQWLNDFNELKVTKQCMISFSIGRYSDNVLCDVIPMQDCHIMLGQPWQFNRNAIHDRRKNRVSLELNKRKYTLAPLTPTQSLDPKVVDSTSPIEELYDDENDKGKKNYFGSVQDKVHNKKFNKAIVDLIPMRKEKRGDVIPLLDKTMYGMYDWFIHILGIPKTPKVFLEVMNYTLNSYVGDLIDFEDDDILMYNKSLTSIDKFNKSNLSSFKVEHDIVDYGFPLVEKRCDVCAWKIVNELVDSSIVLVLNRVLCDNLLAYDTFYGMRRNSSSPDECELNKVFSTNEDEVHDYDHFNAYVSGMIEDAWIYHKSVQFDACSRALVSYFSCSLENFIDRAKLKMHVSFAMASRQGD
ncbi:hypothetical protein KY290_016957 [Solanum tuberosum]|uniref:Uncharacterized protein n=1 Tax=Solanum tuberosum TaxID=4113 RepID=A0ABQ7VBI3_SOLTU|nr:hypothetical protein KY290_016957 [Solanum tuberosum]